MNHGIETYIRSEYHNPGDFAASLQDARKQGPCEKIPSPLQRRVGTILQRRVKQHVGRVFLPIVDGTDRSLSESMVPAMDTIAHAINYLKYPAFAYVTYTMGQAAVDMLTNQNIDAIDVDPSLLMAPLLLATVLRAKVLDSIDAFSLYPSVELDLSPWELTKQDLCVDMEYVIQQMNARAYSLDETHTGSGVDEAIHQFMKRLYGFHTQSTRRPKHAKHPDQMLAKRVTALASPFGEITVADPTNVGSLAHEYMHTQGVLRESEAEFGAIVALIESDNPHLQYCGFNTWLMKLIDAQLEELIGAGEFTNAQEVFSAIYNSLAINGLSLQCIDQLKQSRQENIRLLTTDTTSGFTKRIRTFDNTLMGILNTITGDRVFQRESEKYSKTTASGYVKYEDEPLKLLHVYKYKYLQDCSEQMKD